jgi:hypothetical protein
LADDGVLVEIVGAGLEPFGSSSICDDSSFSVELFLVVEFNSNSLLFDEDVDVEGEKLGSDTMTIEVVWIFLTARLVSFELPVSERVDSVVEFVELFVLLVLLLLLLFAVVLELLLLLVDEELVLALLSVVGLGILSTSCHNA